MIYIILGILLVAVDQLTKFLTIKYIIPNGDITILDKVLSFTYVENKGAAFGILQDGRWFFIILTIIILAFLTIYIVKSKNKSVLFNVIMSLIYAGAIGNFIDRLIKGYVVDMIKTEFMDFPVFNFADCLIVVGIIALAIYILFFDKEDNDE